MKDFREYWENFYAETEEIDWSGIKVLKKYFADFKKYQNAINSLTSKEKTIFDNAEEIITSLEEKKKNLDRKYATVTPTKENAVKFQKQMKTISNQIKKIEMVKKKYQQNFK